MENAIPAKRAGGVTCISRLLRTHTMNGGMVVAGMTAWSGCQSYANEIT